jgi:hypothetical protein
MFTAKSNTSKIVTAEDGSTAAYTVVVSLEPLDTGGGVANAVDGYIDTAGGVETATYSDAAVPVPLPVQIDFSTGWSTLLEAINDAGRIDYDYGRKRDFRRAFGSTSGSNPVTINLTITDLQD